MKCGSRRMLVVVGWSRWRGTGAGGGGFKLVARADSSVGGGYGVRCDANRTPHDDKSNTSQEIEHFTSRNQTPVLSKSSTGPSLFPTEHDLDVTTLHDLAGLFTISPEFASLDEQL
ncbi:eukaryotic translation initiation factor 4 gamma1 [Striga asiatica]|uniref:Eukaryotic translation initiation factor 4 gamma1 n=1 Tax=Striga asiatica TaxID=4170 RepID=A0A5A7P765_STRAF|nr:eukaryotic translation initiation factor 4 gamma1 [Striga asiatica]